VSLGLLLAFEPTRGRQFQWSWVALTERVREVTPAIAPNVDETVTVYAEFVPGGTSAQRAEAVNASVATVWVVAAIAKSK
jgi:hypothetical protein